MKTNGKKLGLLRLNIRKVANLVKLQDRRHTLGHCSSQTATLNCQEVDFGLTGIIKFQVSDLQTLTWGVMSLELDF